MEFTLSEAQNDIQTLAQQILSDQVTSDDLRKFDDRDTERYDGKLWAHMADSGLLGIAIPEEQGGMGFGFSELSFLLEECGRVLAPIPVLPTLLSALVIQKFGSAEQQSMLGGVVTGELVLSAAINEIGNEDFLNPQVEFSNGTLSGIKQGVPYVNLATRLLVIAKDEKKDGNNNPGLFLVDPKDASIDKEKIWSTTQEPQDTLTFNNTPAEKLAGSDAVKFFVEHYIVSLCAYQLGACDAMLKMTAKYTSEREQFGVKVGSFQAVGHRAADCYIDVSCLRLATQQAVTLLAEENLSEAQHISSAVHVAKAWAGDTSHRVSYAAQHLHGGMGVDRDYPLWRYCLWAKQNELMLGSSTYHLEKLGDNIAAGDFDIDP